MITEARKTNHFFERLYMRLPKIGDFGEKLKEKILKLSTFNFERRKNFMVKVADGQQNDYYVVVRDNKLITFMKRRKNQDPSNGGEFEVLDYNDII